jgi:hypothetical protein
MEEATQMLGKMKDIPGLQDMLGKLGPGLFNQLSSHLKKTSTHKKEKQQQPQQPQQPQQQPQQPQQPQQQQPQQQPLFSDEQLISLFQQQKKGKKKGKK